MSKSMLSKWLEIYLQNSKITSVLSAQSFVQYFKSQLLVPCWTLKMLLKIPLKTVCHILKLLQTYTNVLKAYHP